MAMSRGRAHKSSDCLCLGFRLAQHLTHRGCRPGSPPLSPSFQALAGFFNVLEQVRVLEGRTPGGNDGAHAIPHYPDFSIASKKSSSLMRPRFTMLATISQ